MYKLIAFNILFLCSVFMTSGQSINVLDSKVAFELSNFGVNTVAGSFIGMSGEISFSASDISNASFNVCVDANTVNTENKKRDEHLKKEDFFDVEKYPEICFTSTEIIKTNDGYSAKGQLRMHGESNPIEVPFTYNDNTFNGSFTINRRDYGVGPKGGFMVGKDVAIRITCVIE